MRIILISILISIYSIGSGQVCSGPLNITLEGAPSGVPIKVDHSIQHVFCQDAPEGNINLSITGGAPQYNCIWESGYNGDYIDELSPGTYWVTITDSNNCEKLVSFNILQLDPQIDDIHLARESVCGNCYLSDGESTYLYSGSEFFLRLHDIEDGIDVGQIFACLDHNEKVSEYYNWKLHPRSFTIEKAEAPIKIDFFYFNEEFQTLVDSTQYKDNFSLAQKETRLLRFSFKDQKLVPEGTEELEVQFFKDDNIYFAQTVKQENTETKAKYFLALEKEKDLTPPPAPPTAVADSLIRYDLLTNPVRDYLEIIASDPNEKTYSSISIITRDGRKLYGQVFKDEILHGQRISVDDYPQGIYILHIDIIGEQYSRAIKFVKY